MDGRTGRRGGCQGGWGPRMRRRLLLIAAFAAVGVSLSFASAWGCILWRVFVAKRYLGALEGTQELGGQARGWPADWPAPDSVNVTRGWGYERRVMDGQAARYYEPEPRPEVQRADDPGELWVDDPLLDPEVVRERVRLRYQALLSRRGGEDLLSPTSGPRPKSVHWYSMFRRGSGWPLLCMRSSWTDEHVAEFDRAGAVTNQPPRQSIDRHGSGWTARMCYERGYPWPVEVAMPDGTTMAFTLPLRPIWPAFVVNTVIWGVVAWLAWRGAGALRRSRRREEGCCGHCGYPTGVSDVCTECGRPVRANPAKAVL